MKTWPLKLSPRVAKVAVCVKIVHRLRFPIVGWLVLLLYVPSQQLWSLRDGQFT